MQRHTTMNDIETILTELREFNRERDWDQFHNGKDLAIAISIEAGELLEAFLWKSPDDAKVEKVREELADVLNFGRMRPSILPTKLKDQQRSIMNSDFWMAVL